MDQFKKKNFIKQGRRLKRYSLKTYLDGRTYKLNMRRNVWNFRFNRSNIRYFLNKNLNLKTREHKRKIYLYNNFDYNTQLNWNRAIRKIRLYNTYTLRGIFTNRMFLGKRQGRVSTYM